MRMRLEGIRRSIGIRDCGRKMPSGGEPRERFALCGPSPAALPPRPSPLYLVQDSLAPLPRGLRASLALPARSDRSRSLLDARHSHGTTRPVARTRHHRAARPFDQPQDVASSVYETGVLNPRR